MKVLLFANVGNDSQGFCHAGDEAMFLEMYRFYQERFPQVQLYALVSMPSHQNLKMHEKRGLPWPVTKSKARNYFIKLMFKTFVYTKFGISLFNEEQRSFIDYLKQQDLIHFAGGGNLTSECNHWLYYALLVAGVGSLLKKPVILTSQTVGPFTSWIDQFISIKVLDSAQSITLREFSDDQEKKLKQLGVVHAKLSRSIDAAYFLPPYSLPARKNSETLRIGLSLHSRKHNASIIKKMLEKTIEHLSRSYSHIEVVLLPHILNKYQDWDTEFLEDITKDLPPSVKIISPAFHSLVKHEAEIASLIKAYTGSCDIHISSRYHGVIFAISQAVPCITIVDGEYQMMKNLEALRFLFKEKFQNFTVYLNSGSPETELIKKVDFVLNHSANIRSELMKENFDLQRTYKKYLTLLEKRVQKYL